MALRDELTDPAALAQFDLWAFQLRYHAQLAALQRSAHAFQAVLSTIGNVSDATARQSAAATARQGPGRHRPNLATHAI